MCSKCTKNSILTQSPQWDFVCTPCGGQQLDLLFTTQNCFACGKNTRQIPKFSSAIFDKFFCRDCFTSGAFSVFLYDDPHNPVVNKIRDDPDPFVDQICVECNKNKRMTRLSNKNEKFVCYTCQTK
jgi:hypothetical protein